MFAGIYLVSACGSAEEFVAAFRRYADRTGLFVPAASPLPQGKRGRIALTLKDGGVMLEGEAEVVQSSTKSPLHGRAGMMLKFVDLDEPSKTVLAELEKARLAMKPAPPSVPPRPADVPAEPRPVVPPVGGRIDAANALAECVVIGDVATLEDVASGPPKAGPKFVVPSIPAIGGAPRPKTPTGSPPAPANTPPAPTSTPPVAPAAVPAAPIVAAAPAPVTDTPSSKAEQKLTSMGMPALRAPADVAAKKDPTPVPVAAKKDPTPVPVAAKKDPTPAPVAPKQDTAALDAEWDAPADAPAAKPEPAGKKSRMTQLGFPVVKLPADTGTKADSGPKATNFGVVPLRATEAPGGSSAGSASTSGSMPPAGAPAAPKLPEKPPLPQPTPTRSKSPTAPPRQPTPHVPLPVAKLPAKPAPALVEADVDEKTDLTNVPLESANVPLESEITESALIESKPPLADPEPPRPARSGGMRASEILAAVHAEDWTMTPDASEPTVLPADRPMPDVPEPTPAPGAPPTGDWTMSLDPAEGWGKPEKVAPPIAEKPTKIERRAPVIQTPATGNPVKAVASDKPIDIQAWEDKPTSIGAKIEIDATLMEPADPVPPIDEDLPAAPFPPAGSAPGMAMAPPDRAPEMPPPGLFNGYGGDAPPPHLANATGPESAVAQSLLQQAAPLPPPPALPAPAAPMPQEIPIGYAPTLLPGQLTAPPPLQYATAQPGDLYRSDAMPVVPPRSNKKLIVVVASAVVVIALAVVLALTMGGKKKHASEQHAGSGSSAPVVKMAGSDEGSQHVAVVVPDEHGTPGSAEGSAAGSSEGSAQQAVTPPKPPTPPVPPPTKETCAVEVASTPAGAEVSLDDKTVLGTTPGTFQLPCGTATKLKIQKAKYLGVVRSVTPAASGTKLAVTLGQGTFAVKITSTPAGATITVGGKAKGVTPTAVQLPALQTVTITLSKEGYTTDSQKVVIKTNGMAHHVTLRKSTKAAPVSHGLKGI